MLVNKFISNNTTSTPSVYYSITGTADISRQEMVSETQERFFKTFVNDIVNTYGHVINYMPLDRAYALILTVFNRVISHSNIELPNIIIFMNGICKHFDYNLISDSDIREEIMRDLTIARTQNYKTYHDFKRNDIDCGL